MANAPALKLLYISAVQSRSGEGILSLQSRINIGVLSRDFEISLAVVGPVTAEGLHRLRVDLGPVRVPWARQGWALEAPVWAADPSRRLSLVK